MQTKELNQNDTQEEQMVQMYLDPEENGMSVGVWKREQEWRVWGMENKSMNEQNKNSSVVAILLKESHKKQILG